MRRPAQARALFPSSPFIFKCRGRPRARVRRMQQANPYPSRTRPQPWRPFSRAACCRIRESAQRGTIGGTLPIPRCAPPRGRVGRGAGGR